jgi:hypothetical protein
MKKLFLLSFFLTSLVYAGPPGASEPPVWNPFGGHLQYLGPGFGLKIGEIYYLYQDGTSNAYFTFDGTNLCLFVNSVQQICYSSGISTCDLLLESGAYLLFEDGTKFALETCGTPPSNLLLLEDGTYLLLEDGTRMILQP